MTYLVHHARVALLAVLVCGFAGPTQGYDKVDKDPRRPPQFPLKEVKAGDIPDAELLRTTPAPAYLTNAEAFEALWKAWKIEGKPPEVDFKTEMLIVGTTVFNTMQPNVVLDDKGDLKAIFIHSRGAHPGFRYVILSVKKEGVKSVNGVAIKE